MIEETKFETFLYISKNEYQIFVFDNKKKIDLYKKKIKYKNSINFLDFNSLQEFLDTNIYKIEKLIGEFIKNIILIIESDEVLNVNIGVKKKNYNDSLDKKYLKNNLTELKDLFKENYQKQTIMHMIVENYIIDKKKYSSFIENLNSDHLSLEVNFFSISNKLVLELEKVLEKYQIKIIQFMSGSYVKSFLNDENNEIYSMALELKDGLNENEVILIPKNIENKGFFEKFFQLFS